MSPIYSSTMSRVRRQFAYIQHLGYKKLEVTAVLVE
jgi:hypothetical protein